ncbi:MAG: hypothetical protein WCF72_21210, partial [Pseudolabrys sp.]
EWHFEMDDDKEKAVTTRKRILDMLAADRVFVASFHMPFPGVGYVDKGQGGYRWVPHSYQLNLARRRYLPQLNAAGRSFFGLGLSSSQRPTRSSTAVAVLLSKTM